MSGLGIDLGPETLSARQPSGPRERSRSRSHTISSETRRVRIASGQPLILGADEPGNVSSPDLAPYSSRTQQSAVSKAQHHQMQRSVSLAGPTPPLSDSGAGSDVIYDSYAEEVKAGYVPDGFGGWIKAEDIGAGRVPPPITPSDSPLIIQPAPKAKLRVTNPSPSKSMLTPPTSEPSTTPDMPLKALPDRKNGAQSPASMALSDITVSSKSSSASTSTSSQRKIRKLISSRRPNSSSGEELGRNRSRSRSMSLFLGRPKSASGVKDDKDEGKDQGSASGRSSPVKEGGSSRGKLSKSRSHASLVSWSATGWAGTGVNNDGAASPSSVSAYSDAQDGSDDAADQTLTAPTEKVAFQGPAHHLYDSPVRHGDSDTPRQEDQVGHPDPHGHLSLRSSSAHAQVEREQTLRSNTRSSSRLNAQAAEFNPRPPTAVAMAPSQSSQAPSRQMSSNSNASAVTSDSAGTVAAQGLPPMRSMRFWAGLEGASRGEAMVCLDPVTGQFVQGEAIVPGRIVSNRTVGLGIDDGSIIADSIPHSGSRQELRQGGDVGSAYQRMSTSGRESRTSWAAESSSELGPHDSASNVGRSSQTPSSQPHVQPRKTIHRQQSVPILPSTAQHTVSQVQTTRQHQRYDAAGTDGASAGRASMGGLAMDRHTNHTVTGVPMSVEERQRQSTMMTNSSHGTTSSNASLDRSGTLLSATANPARRSRELTRLLGNSTRKLSASAAKAAPIEGGPRLGGDGDEDGGGQSGASSASASGLGIEGLSGPLSNTIVPNALTSNGRPSSMMSASASSSAVQAAQSSNAIAALEQAKSGRARVEVDLALETDLVVEGGSLRGRLQVKVRKPNDGEGTVMLAQPKIRIVGFEELMGDDTRHIFYHHAMAIDGDRSNGGPSEPYVLHGSPNIFSPQTDGRIPLPCFSGPPDHEGFCRGVDGTHSIPFALDIPIGKGAKGSYRGKAAVVRYIVIGSVKLKSSNGQDRSIAHFYRHVELFPYLNPAVVLSAASRPLVSSGEKGLFMGGSGKVLLTASLHRSTWVAGQRVYVKVGVRNDTTKKVKNLHLALVRTVTLFRPKPEFNVGFSVPADPAESYIDPDACTTSTTRKKICEDTLELGQKGTKGSVTARGWWTGVDPGCSLDVSHYMTIPADALTISRGRHVEVLYSIKVAVSGTLSSDVSVELPLRVINFVSLDPPPAKHGSSSAFGSSSSGIGRSWSQAANAEGNALTLNMDSRGATRSRTQEAPMIARVRSMDALKSPTRVEVGLRQPVNLPVPPAQGHGVATGGDPRQAMRRLQHQKSLDFINHAIRSATARRGLPSSTSNSPLGLGIEVPDDSELESMEYHEAPQGLGIMPTDHLRRLSMASLHSHGSQSSVGPIDPNCLPYVHSQVANPHLVPPALSVNPQLLLNSVSLDEAGDDYDKDDVPLSMLRRQSQSVTSSTPISMNDDSVDEIDLVVHSTQMEGQAVFDDSRAGYDDEDDEGNTTFDSVSTARCIREEPEEEDAQDVGRATDPMNVTAPLQFTKKSTLSVVATQEDDDATPTSFQSSTFSHSEAEDQGSPASDSEIGTAEVALRLSPTSNGSCSPRSVTPSEQMGGERKSVGAFANEVSEQARSSHGRRHRHGRGRSSKEPLTEGRSGREASTISKGPTLQPAGSLRRTRSNIEDTISRPSSRASSISRAPSPTKMGAAAASTTSSSKKGSLKKTSSFTFATLDKPLKMQREQMASVATSGDRAAGAGQQTELKAKVKAQAQRQQLSQSQHQPQQTGVRARGQGSGKNSSSTSPTTASASAGPAVPPKTSSTGSKPMGNAPVLKAKVSTSALLPTKRVEAPSAGGAGAHGLSGKSSVSSLRREAESGPAAGASGASTSATTGDTSVASERDAQSLHRSSSTHNLRGSAVVIPSVRNKIALLESRSQLLRDFAAPVADVSVGGTSLGGGGVGGNGEVPVRRGGGAGRASMVTASSSTSAVVASTTRTRTPSSAASTSTSQAVLPGSMSLGRLARAGSVLSVAGSEDSMATSTYSRPDYLKRSDSLMSFKAPVLRASVKALVQERERGA